MGILSFDSHPHVTCIGAQAPRIYSGRRKLKRMRTMTGYSIITPVQLPKDITLNFGGIENAVEQQLVKKSDAPATHLVGWITVIRENNHRIVCFAKTLAGLMNRIDVQTCAGHNIQILYNPSKKNLIVAHDGTTANVERNYQGWRGDGPCKSRIYPVTDSFTVVPSRSYGVNEEHQSAIYGLIPFCRKYARNQEDCELLDTDRIHSLTTYILADKLSDIACTPHKDWNNDQPHPFEDLLHYIPYKTLKYIFRQNAKNQFVLAETPQAIYLPDYRNWVEYQECKKLFS